MPKCEILVREKPTRNATAGNGMTIEVVELFKKFDGEPKQMFKWFRGFADWVQRIVDTQPATTLRDANTMSALMIVFDMDWTKKFVENHPEQPKTAIIPDVRPRGSLDNCEFLYLVDLPFQEDIIKNEWNIRIRCWPTDAHNDRYLELIQKGNAPPKGALKHEVFIELPITQSIIAKMRKKNAPVKAKKEGTSEPLDEEERTESLAERVYINIDRVSVLPDNDMRGYFVDDAGNKRYLQRDERGWFYVTNPDMDALLTDGL